jgi:FlaA1/EpsC-like NDP-sugar epimerase
MTIPEASSLVLMAGGIDVEGDLFLLDMGEPILIQELAEQMIRFYEFEPNQEIKLVYTGLRSGEKLSEKLWSNNETVEETSYPKIIRLKRKRYFYPELEKLLEQLRPICFLDPNAADLYRNRRELKKRLREVVPTLKLMQDEPEH